MTGKKNYLDPMCVVLNLVGAKWKFLIVKELLIKEQRFIELKKNLGCTSKVLSDCLKKMEEDGLIIKCSISTDTNKCGYCLTDIGYTLRSVTEPMQKWGKEYKHLKKLMEKRNHENNLSGA